MSETHGRRKEPVSGLAKKVSPEILRAVVSNFGRPIVSLLTNNNKQMKKSFFARAQEPEVEGVDAHTGQQACYMCFPQ